jgi:transposase
MFQGVSMKRRKIDAETKMVAPLEGLRGDSSLADICRKYQISESLYYGWRDQFLVGGSQALSARNGSAPETAVEARISALGRIIGKQAVPIKILVKSLKGAGIGLLGLLAEGLRFSGLGDLYRLEMASGHRLSAVKDRAGVQPPNPQIAGEPRPRG